MKNYTNKDLPFLKPYLMLNDIHDKDGNWALSLSKNMQSNKLKLRNNLHFDRILKQVPNIKYKREDKIIFNQMVEPTERMYASCEPQIPPLGHKYMPEKYQDSFDLHEQEMNELLGPRIRNNSKSPSLSKK